jgi:putative sigma-54 modulation protein
MQFRFAFKHMDTSPALTRYAEEKIAERINKFVTKPIEAHVTFSVENLNHGVKCTLAGGDGFNLEVEHVCGDMYGSIDHMVDKLATQLKRHKEKLKGHKSKRQLRLLDPMDKNYAFSAQRDFDIENEPVDAEEILKFEVARRRMAR